MLSTGDVVVISTCTAVGSFWLGMLTEAWTRGAEDAESLTDIADQCHPDDHELGRHSPGVGA